MNFEMKMRQNFEIAYNRFYNTQNILKNILF